MVKFNFSKIFHFSAAAFFAAILIFLSYSRVFDDFEFKLLDVRYRLRPVGEVDQEIVIIEIADDTISRLGEWPIDRSYHALLVRALSEAGAEKIIFDIFFSEKRHGDEQFVYQVERAGNVYLPYVFSIYPHSRNTRILRAEGYAAPLLPELERAAVDTGYINIDPDRDGKVRRFPPLMKYEEEYYPQLTFIAALHRLGYAFDDIEVHQGKKIVIDNDLVIPMDENSMILLDYPGRWGEVFRHYSYADVIQSYMGGISGDTPLINLEELEGAVCFVALTATASPDAHPSPLETLYPGVGVHTSLYNSMLNWSFLRRLNRLGNILILIVLWVLTIYLTEQSPRRYAPMFLVLVLAGFSVVSFVCFWPLGLWIDLFYPLVTIVGVYTAFSFKKYMEEVKKREVIEKELSIAKHIQESFLPDEIPSVGSLKVYVRMLTARQVGGDLFDVIEPEIGKLGVMIGDVSGKGVPAALYMARVMSIFKTVSADSGEVSGVLEKMNRTLAFKARSGLFVTMTYMVFDVETNTFNYSIGGHMPTIEVSPGGEVSLLDVEEGLPLGMMEGAYKRVNKKYVPGSLYILYSDGVTEAMNSQKEMFGQERLIELASSLAGATAKEAVMRMHEEVFTFTGKAEQHDDITIMAIKT